MFIYVLYFLITYRADTIQIIVRHYYHAYHLTISLILYDHTRNTIALHQTLALQRYLPCHTHRYISLSSRTSRSISVLICSIPSCSLSTSYSDTPSSRHANFTNSPISIAPFKKKSRTGSVDNLCRLIFIFLFN